MTLTWVKRGEVIDVVNEIAQTTEPIMVVSPCELRAKGYYCSSCRCYLANVGNLLMHAESPGVHRVAVYCRDHRLYEEPENPQVEAFARIAVDA